MAAGKGEKVEGKGAAAAKKEQIGVDVTYEEKGARVVEKGEMGVKAINEDKGVSAEGKMIETVVEKGGEDSTAVGEEEGEIVEGKGKEKGKKREPVVVEKDPTVDWELEWKWKVKTATYGEGSKMRREPRRWRSMRRDQGAAVEKEEEEEEEKEKGKEKEKEEKEKDTTAATEKVGEKMIFLFSATTATIAEKMITLVSSKGQPFMMSEAAARLSVVLANMIDNGCASGNIPLPKVDDRALATVIRYCDKHAAAEHGAVDEGIGSSGNANTMLSKNKKALDEWDRKLIHDLTKGALYDLIIAAHFLNIKGLLDVCCHKVADMIKKKTPTQVRETFGIANDFTAEDEEVLRNESPWVFDEEKDA